MKEIRYVGKVTGKEYLISEEVANEILIRNIPDAKDILKADSTTITDAGGVKLNAHVARHKKDGGDAFVKADIRSLLDCLTGIVTIDPPSIAAGATANVDVSVTGLTTDHRVILQCQSDLEHGLVPIAAYVPTSGTLRVRLTNFTGAAIDGAARPWFYIAWIP